VRPGDGASPTTSWASRVTVETAITTVRANRSKRADARTSRATIFSVGVRGRGTAVVSALVLSLLPACSLFSPDAACATATTRKVDLRFLILGTNADAPTLRAWQAALQA